MLSQTGEYALRAVAFIAQHAEKGPVLARDIATGAAVPHEYLQKLLTELVRNGVLASTRGIGGGFRLGKPAEQLRLVDVIAPFDDVMQRTQCPFGNPKCGEENPCPVHDRWSDVVTSYSGFLESTTVAALVRKAAGELPQLGKPSDGGEN
jgi:Rrf2 family protein